MCGRRRDRPSFIFSDMKRISSKSAYALKNNLLLGEKDIFADLTEKTGSSLFLGKYTIAEVEAALEKRNFYREAQKRNLFPLVFDLSSTETPSLQRFRIYHQEKKADHLIVDLKIREGRYRLKDPSVLPFSFDPFRFLMLEWLTLQNPTLSFLSGYAPLPGQNKPSLGLGRKVLEQFIFLARLNGNSGLLAFPAYFHNAILFSRRFFFLNPEKEAEVRAICKSFREIGFKKLAWIVHLDALHRADGTVYSWEAEEQICPLHPTLKKYFASNSYRGEVKRIIGQTTFTVRWDIFKTKAAELNLSL